MPEAQLLHRKIQSARGARLAAGVELLLLLPLLLGPLRFFSVVLLVVL